IDNGTHQGGTNTMVITNCTFADNTGKSINNANGNANITIQNSILWDVTPLSNAGSETTIRYSFVNGTSLATGTTDGGNNQLNVDPLFTDVTGDDYSLTSFSGAIDAGSDALLPGGYTLDLSNGTRVLSSSVDLGAMEAAGGAITQIYVDKDATGANDGSSWADAYTSLKAATDAAGAGISVWVAEGTYTATAGSDRTAAFEIASGVAIYGGFAGTETMLSQRDWAANPTIMSGDIGTQGNATDNSYNVVRMQNATSTTLLDGLIIEDGNANGGSYPYNRGGGLSNNGMNAGNASNPTLQNCIFRWNAGTNGGAISNMSNFSGTVNATITGCLFYENTSTNGAAIDNGTYSSGTNNTVITNCTFADNTGKSINNANGNANITIQNSILWDATPLYNSGSETTIQYSSINSTSLPTGTTDGGDNQLNTDPLFTDAANDDYTLQGTSQAIGKGNNTYLPGGYTLDLAHNNRTVGATVEMGCYEDGASAADPMDTDPIVDNSGDANTTVNDNTEVSIGALDNNEHATMVLYPNPVQDVLNVNVNGLDDSENARVYLQNTQGQVLYQEGLDINNGETLQLNIDNLPKGLYFLNIQFDNGKQLTERVIKF
ncbi:MAG: T9SS type A sorting domain-containing protein, partial [Aureispira sp.]|nr:T9SS type A sorting domain-containing protein [Aureispira sp.]